MDRTCCICTHGIIDPGLPSQEVDAFDCDDEERSDSVEDKHIAILHCLGYAVAESSIVICFRVISPLVVFF